MKEFKIKRMTMEEFKLKYHVEEKPGEDLFSCGYSLSELGDLMDRSEEDKTYILVEDKVYAELDLAKNEVCANHLSDQEIVESVEKLNERFRDSLIDLREYLYSGRGAANSSQAKEIQLLMNQCIQEAKEILDKYNIRSRDQLKVMSNKHFIAEFLNGLFEDELYNVDIEIDCGL